MGQVLVATQNQLNALDPGRPNKRLPFIIYDGFTSNILTGGKAANPDSLCIDQKEANLFVNADFRNLTSPEKWKPETDVSPFICK